MIAAYVLVWVALLVFVAVFARGVRRNERDLARIEARLAKMEKGQEVARGEK